MSPVAKEVFCIHMLCEKLVKALLEEWKDQLQSYAIGKHGPACEKEVVAMRSVMLLAFCLDNKSLSNGTKTIFSDAFKSNLKQQKSYDASKFRASPPLQ